MSRISNAFFGAMFLSSQMVLAAGNAPYAYSSLITGITFNQSSWIRLASGSDEWPYSEAADGNLYVSWGDGGGFGGSNTVGRVGLGIAKIGGFPPAITTTNIVGGVNPASTAPSAFSAVQGGSNLMLAINGNLYTYVAFNFDLYRRLSHEVIGSRLHLAEFRPAFYRD